MQSVRCRRRMPGNDHSERRRREALRRSFLPAQLRLLFIGESPPASGRFFYQRDSGLYRAMCDTFQIADPSLTNENFLSAFLALGCYLIDLCPEPVDHLDSKSRLAACRAAEEGLGRMIAELQPPVIATVLRSIEGNVARAVSLAAWQGELIHLPYPGKWSHHRDRFADTLVPSIRMLLRG